MLINQQQRTVLQAGGFPWFIVNKLRDANDVMEALVRKTVNKLNFPNILFVTGANTNQKELFFVWLAGMLLQEYPNKYPKYIFTPAMVGRDVGGHNKFLTQADEVSKGRQATDVLAVIYDSIFSKNLVVIGCLDIDSFYSIYGISFVSSYQDIVKVVHVGKDEHKITLEEI